MSLSKLILGLAQKRRRLSQIWFILKLFAKNNQNMCILGLALVFIRRNTYFLALETIAISSFSCSDLHLVLFKVFSLPKKFRYFVSRMTRFMLFVFLDKTLALVIIECWYCSFLVKNTKVYYPRCDLVCSLETLLYALIHNLKYYKKRQ